MSVLHLRAMLVAGLGLLFASPLLAQPTVGHFSHLEGSVTRLHRFAPVVTRNGDPLLAGDEVHTMLGRAEITTVDGTIIEIDQHTRVALHAVDRIQVVSGRVFVQNSGAGPFFANTGAGRVHVSADGVAEITTTAANRDLLVRVIDGEARIESPWGIEPVAATQMAFVSGPTGRPYVSPSVAPETDSFYQYAGTRFDFLTPPATFLPYAHPVYRQQQYLRLLRKALHHPAGHVDRNRDHERERAGDAHGPEGDADGGRRADIKHRADVGVSPRRIAQPDAERPAQRNQTAPASERRDRAQERPKTQERPAAVKPAAPAAKGAGAGVAVPKP